MNAYEAAAQVIDPELRVVTIGDLGILRGVDTSGGRVSVTVTPTYSGCPAMAAIRSDIADALRTVGWSHVEIVTRLRPAWSTDWITESGRAKLAAAGIAPPPPASPGDRPRRRLPLLATAPLPCPRCGGADTEQVSWFGPTACTSLWRCRTCAEPFGHLRAH